MAQRAKNLPATRETPVQFLGEEDPLEKGKAAYSSILAWRIPWTVARQAPLPWDSPGKNLERVAISFSRGSS